MKHMITVAVLFGGPSSEHGVSLLSVKNILESIDREKYDVLEVFISKDLLYTIDDEQYSEENGLDELMRRNIDIVLPVLHGKYGEDGVLQKHLENRNMKFVGSSSNVSALVIDKWKTNECLSQNTISIPRSSVVTVEKYTHDLRYPIIVKPVDEGSSLSLFKFTSEEEYLSSLPIVFNKHDVMLAQEFITGREFTCGVFEKDGKDIPLVASEIILTQGDLFDYDAKYLPNGCREITPAQVDERLMQKIQALSVECHSILGCKSISRTDLILQEGTLYVLEVNTFPGMTATSFVPAQVKACGYSMKEFITILVSSAL